MNRRVPLPEQFRVEEAPGVLRIRWRWFNAQTLRLLLFCIAWDGFLALWYGNALAAKSTPWHLLVLPLGHLAVGGVLSYTAIAKLLNASVVEVSPELLVVRHGPVPWAGQRRLSASDISELFCEESAKRKKGRVVIRHHLNARVRGQTVRVVANLEDRQQALYLQQAIETRLRISALPSASGVPNDGVAA